MKLKNRRLKDGVIRFEPCWRGIFWEVMFELPRCSYFSDKTKKWSFFQQGKIDISSSVRELTEIEVYYIALEALVRQMNDWLRIVERAVEYEKKVKS